MNITIDILSGVKIRNLTMPRTYIKRGIRCNFDRQNMQKAILEVKKGVPIRTAAAKFDVPVSTLGKHYKDPEKTFGAGRKQEILEEDEAALAKYLEVCAIHGEGLTRLEMLELVKEFIDNSKIKTRWIDNKPGNDWLVSFFKRHSHLRIRKGEKLSNQRVRGADPFAVYNFYKNVKKMFKKEKIIEDSAGLIYNCDETSFSHDPDDVRVIAKKGTKRVSKNVAGSGKTNTTVLACGAADGSKMPPFIIFSGTYVWNTWIPKDDYPGTAYTAQKKGWMEGSIFANWFSQVFLKNIPSKEDRNGKKVILFFDGVAFHINYAIVKMAYDNSVILIKLPPNLTHYMQPLDKTVFKPLKGAWNTLMIQWNRRHPGIPLPKEEFSRYIKTLWEENFHPRLLRSGFLNTGLFPVDESKFPEEAYDPIKLQRFRAEQTAKAKKNMSGSSSIVSTPTSTQSIPTTPLNLPVTTLAPSTPKTVTIPTSVDHATPSSEGETATKANATNIETEVLSYPLPDANQPQCSSWPDGTQSPSTFENFIRFKLTENVMKSRPKISGKRKKISEHKGEILTSKTVMERIRKSEEDKKEKGTRKIKPEKGKKLLKKTKLEVDSSDSKQLKARPTKKQTTTKRKLCPSDSSVSSDSLTEDEMCALSTDEDDLAVDLITSSDDDIPEEFDPKNVKPKLELYYAVYYDVQWYIGRVIDFPDEGLCKVKFLKKELQGYDWPRHEDIQVVPESFVFYGPVHFKGNGPFHITQGEVSKIRLIYKKIKKDFKAQ